MDLNPTIIKTLDLSFEGELVFKATHELCKFVERCTF